MTQTSNRKVVAAVLAAAALLTAGQFAGFLGPTASAQSAIAATGVDGALPVTDPAADAWSEAALVQVALSGQLVATPTRPTPFVPSLGVRVLVNDTHAAFLLTWDDATKDNRTTEDQEFRDAAAILFGPAGPAPSVCMGGPGQQLQVAQWKADWQADLEEGFRDLEHAYPNFWVDYYPGAIGTPPYHLPDAFPETARVYLPGWYVGNPFSDPLKVTAVEEANAQGFGTLATQNQQDALGRGAHSGTGWSVVVARPLAPSDPEDVAIASGIVLAFALWDGTSGDVGARKSASSWFVLELPGAGAAPATFLLWLLPIVLAVVLVFIAAKRRRRKPSRVEE